MNRKTLIALAAGLASLAFNTTAHADDTTPATIDVQATCDGITVTTAGWPDGSHGIVGVGDQGPGGATINATVTYPINNPYNVDAAASAQKGDIGWAVDIWLPGSSEIAHVGGVLNCVPLPVVADVPTMTIEAPVSPISQTPLVALFRGLDLALYG